MDTRQREALQLLVALRLKLREAFGIIPSDLLEVLDQIRNFIVDTKPKIGS